MEIKRSIFLPLTELSRQFSSTVWNDQLDSPWRGGPWTVDRRFVSFTGLCAPRQTIRERVTDTVIPMIAIDRTQLEVFFFMISGDRGEAGYVGTTGR